MSARADCSRPAAPRPRLTRYVVARPVLPWREPNAVHEAEPCPPRHRTLQALAKRLLRDARALPRGSWSERRPLAVEGGEQRELTADERRRLLALMSAETAP